MLTHRMLFERVGFSTVTAEIGFFAVCAYYAHAWRRLSEISHNETLGDNIRSRYSEALRFLQRGAALSVLFFMLIGALEAGSDWLYVVAGVLVGFCGALAGTIIGVGFIAFWNLWRELLLQFKKASPWRLFVSLPLAISLLALGLGVLVLLGGLVDKLPRFVEPIFPGAAWALIAIAFYNIWIGRSHAALALRAILLTAFTAIAATALAVGFWMVSKEMGRTLVLFLLGIVVVNAAFYSRWVRADALRDNFCSSAGSI